MAVLDFQTFSKDSGRRLNLKLCMNLILKNSVRSGRGRTLHFLKSGSVWALYFAPHTILIACFCFLNNSDKVELFAPPHTCIPYIRWECIRDV